MLTNLFSFLFFLFSLRVLVLCHWLNIAELISIEHDVIEQEVAQFEVERCHQRFIIYKQLPFAHLILPELVQRVYYSEALSRSMKSFLLMTEKI